MKIKGVNHVGIRTSDRQASEDFYIGILGFVSHPEKTNWLRSADGEFSVHLMPARSGFSAGQDIEDLARHVAFEVDDLEAAAATLLSKGLGPFQASLGGERKQVTHGDDLDFGIGTVFVVDPDGNVVELVDRRRGIFVEVLGDEP